MAMTEAEWLAKTANPTALLRSVRKDSSPRKLRLVAAAICRIYASHGRLTEFLAEIDLSTLHADGVATDDDFVRSRQLVQDSFQRADQLGYFIACLFSSNAMFAAHEVLKCRGANTAAATRFADRRAVCDIFREVFGNPFRPFTLLPSWGGGGFEQPDGVVVRPTSDVIGLAAAIHQTGDFARLPILADALEEAGATDETLLSHCRGPGPHVRGCWAHDLARGVS